MDMFVVRCISPDADEVIYGPFLSYDKEGVSSSEETAKKWVTAEEHNCPNTEHVVTSIYDVTSWVDETDNEGQLLIFTDHYPNDKEDEEDEEST